MKPDKREPPFNIGEVVAKRVVFKWRSNYPLVLKAKEDNEFRDEVRAFGFYAEDSWDKSKWFAFWEADCFDPPIYIVRADSWESAYDTFIEEFGTAVSETDLKDYKEDDERLVYTQNGHYVDTECIQGEEIQLVSAHF